MLFQFVLSALPKLTVVLGDLRESRLLAIDLAHAHIILVLAHQLLDEFGRET
jgi:hypothetical protein